MRRLAILTVALVLGSALPGGQATHLSVGWSDNVGVDSEESAEDPTVPKEDYQIGTSTDCFDPDPTNRSVDHVERTQQADAFCGELVYHEGSSFENVADRDQQTNGPIGHFDVVRSSQPPRGYSVCPAWCTSAGGPLFGAFHDVGAELGLTDNGSEADRREGERSQAYELRLVFPAAAQVVQDNVDAWRMNGWYQYQPVHETFVAFLTDRDGETIDDERLQEIIRSNRGKLSQNHPVEAAICGFRDSGFVYNFGLVGVTYSPGEKGWCDVYFQWVGESGDEPDFRDGYNDRCDSPTYVCGALQPAWRAAFACPAFDGCTRGGTSSTEANYTVWHWAVAPTRSACNGQQLPGMSFDTRAPWDYLAHDVDVWTPVTSVRGAEGTEGVHHLRHYGEQASVALVGSLQNDTQDNAEAALEEANNRTKPVREEIGNLTDELPGGPGVPTLPTAPTVFKDSRVEPNHAVDELDRMGLYESSQTEQWARPGPQNVDSCTATFGDTEQPEFVDPWVNVVDMDVVTTRVASLLVIEEPPALYGNDEQRQDSVNRPTSGFTSFSGKVGVFTDKNDNGYYDQPFARQFGTIDEGAYPLFWDLRLDEDGEIAPNRGCDLEEGSPLSEAMKQAHYGPHTGLVLAVYLEEASMVSDSSSSSSMPLPLGQNIVLFESQSMTQLRRDNDPRATSFLDRIVDGLKAHPDIPETAQTVYVNDEMGRTSSFNAQCGASTGGFSTSLSVLHQCASGCQGDTIVTGYMVESTHPDLQIGSEQGGIPPLEFDSGEVFELDQRVETWLDVDPFDGDPERNRKNSSAPPH